MANVTFLLNNRFLKSMGFPPFVTHSRVLSQIAKVCHTAYLYDTYIFMALNSGFTLG